MSALSIELGVSVTYHPTSFYQIMDLLDAGHIDMSDLFDSPVRREKYAFTQPLYRLQGVAVTGKNSSLGHISDLLGKRLALVEDDFAVEYFKQNYPSARSGIEFVMVKDMKEGLTMLSQGKVDALAGDDTVINYYADALQLRQQIRELGEPLYEQNVTFAVRKDDEILLSILNKGILNLKKKNILVQAQSKWFDSSAPVITDINAMRWLPFTVVAVLLVMAGFLFWQGVMDRKIAERTREIQLQKDNQRTIIDNIRSMLLVLDRNRTVTDANQLAVQILQEKEDMPLIGMSAADIPLLAALLDGYRPSEPDRLHTFCGRFYTIAIRPLSGVDEDQLIVIEDHTEQTMTERRLRQESKMSAVGQLSAGLAHEIRNPLGLIKNYTYLLRSETEEDEVTSHAISVISDSTDRINGLIENLLNFSRLGDERLSQVNLYSLVHSIASLEHKKMERAGIKLTIDCPEDACFYTSEETLKIVLINLLNNAVDALTDGAETDDPEKVRKISCIISPGPQELQITVRDTGPGISEEVAESLFNPFFTTKDSGTGLGLYTAASELDRLGGTIQLDSEYKDGASFTVKIPVKEEAAT